MGFRVSVFRVSLVSFDVLSTVTKIYLRSNKFAQLKICTHTSWNVNSRMQGQNQNSKTEAETVEKCFLLGHLPWYIYLTLLYNPGPPFSPERAPCILGEAILYLLSKKWSIDRPICQFDWSHYSMETCSSKVSWGFVKLTKTNYINV